MFRKITIASARHPVRATLRLLQKVGSTNNDEIVPLEGTRRGDVGRTPDKIEYYGQEEMVADETAFACLKNCGKCVARHGVGMQRKRECGDILPESV